MQIEQYPKIIFVFHLRSFASICGQSVFEFK